MLFLASQFGAYFTYAFKTIGLSVKISDKVLSMASSASGLIQLFARIGFGSLYDKVGFKSIFYSIMALNTLNGLLVYRFRHNEVFFVLCIEMTYIVFSGMYSMLPTATYQTFGPKQGPRAYAVILLGSTVCAFTSYLEQHFLYDIIGVENILYLGSVGSVLAIIVCSFFNETLDFERMEKLGLIKWGEFKH